MRKATREDLPAIIAMLYDDESGRTREDPSLPLDPRYIAAAHFQNHRVPGDQACYTCHTDYALYGGIRAKWRGLHHVWVQYFGNPPAPEGIRLYSPYNNRECLHCHLGARSFEESPIHSALRDSLVSNETSCVSSGCHDTVHNIETLNNFKSWRPKE